MKESSNSSSNRWRFGLRYKVALLFGLPVMLISALILLDHYTGEKEALEEQARITSIQTGNLILASLKHSMVVNDRSMMESILTGTGEQGGITRVWIIDLNGIVQVSSVPSDIKTQLDTQMLGCIECHQYPPASRPNAQRISNVASTVRIITPINNEAECSECHRGGEKHLGVLLTDISLANVENQLLVHLRQNVTLTLLMTLLAILAAIGMANLLVIRRIEVMHDAMNAFEKGDFSVRITRKWRTDDELTRLADTFNRMVSSIERHEEEQQKITSIRLQAMMDERERIARELHDGVAQFLGYVNTKIIAISTLLGKRDSKAAQKHIDQIMQAVHDQSVDVRASIIGLKLAERSGENFAGSLKDYIRQCNLLLDLTIELIIDPNAEKIHIDPEIELHLIRIVQEAISNIRKHAHAKVAQVKVTIAGDRLVLTIRDDGVGFNPWQLNIDHQPHFGLQTMRERAELAGAEFSLVSEPGIGTTVTLQAQLETT